MQLLLAQPGLNLGGVEVVLLGLVHGVQDQLPPLSLGPEQSPEVGQLVVAGPGTVGLWAAYGGNDRCPLQDVFYSAPVALQLPLKRLKVNGTETVLDVENRNTTMRKRVIV